MVLLDLFVRILVEGKADGTAASASASN